MRSSTRLRRWRPFAVALVVSAALAAGASAASPSIVISQVYGGGGNQGARYRNDFVELFNRGTTAVDVGGWSVQYASSAGSTWKVTVLAGAIPPGGHLLVREAAGACGALDLPAAGATGDTAMSATAGKVALVDSAVPLSGACPPAGSVVDLVGYGGAATCSEGGHNAPGLGNTQAAMRRGGGCADTDDNAADFVTSPPAPRNAANPAHGCGALPETPIHAIQGAGATSPLAGQAVATSGIVTGVRSDGFFLQADDASADGDPSTSEGIFVYTGGPAPAEALVGNRLQGSGTVAEYVPDGDPFAPPLTELVRWETYTVVGGPAGLPAALEITAADTDPVRGLEQLERLEGMRVRVAALDVVGPSTEGAGAGAFYGVVAGVPRPFREAGVEAPWPLPAAACCVPRFDGNPERLRVDSGGLVGAAAIAVAAGASVAELVGPLHYDNRAYTILPDVAQPPAVTDTAVPRPVAAAAPGRVTLGSANLHDFFDAADDPGAGDDVLTAQELEDRLAKTSLYVRSVLGAPDVLGVIEVENLDVLGLLAARIDADAAAAGAAAPGYAAYLVEGNDGRGIDVGFLVRADRVTVVETVQEGKDATYVDPETGLQRPTFDRPPLRLQALALAATPPLAVTVIVAHLKSLIDIEDPCEGDAVRAKRHAQAEYLAALVGTRLAADPGEHLAVAGDLNAFEFNDGYVDVVGTLRGAPAPAGEVERAGADLVEPDLVDLVERLPLEERYSYVYRGNAQALDHVLVSPGLLRHLVGFELARCNADFPAALAADPARPERSSDHDAAVATFVAREPHPVRRRLAASP